MSKLLAKTLQNAVHEKRLVAGARQVMRDAGKSSLIVFSESHHSARLRQVAEHAKTAGVPTLQYADTSMALGKLCGLQFRVSALSMTEVDESIVNAIIKENE